MSKVTSITLLFPLRVQMRISRGMTDTCGDTWDAAGNAPISEAEAGAHGRRLPWLTDKCPDKRTLTPPQQRKMAVVPLGRNTGFHSCEQSSCVRGRMSRRRGPPEPQTPGPPDPHTHRPQASRPSARGPGGGRPHPMGHRRGSRSGEDSPVLKDKCRERRNLPRVE